MSFNNSVTISICKECISKGLYILMGDFYYEREYSIYINASSTIIKSHSAVNSKITTRYYEIYSARCRITGLTVRFKMLRLSKSVGAIPHCTHGLRQAKHVKWTVSPVVLLGGCNHIFYSAQDPVSFVHSSWMFVKKNIGYL